MDLKSQYKQYQHQKLQAGKQRWDKYAGRAKHPIQYTRQSYNYAHQYANQNWKSEIAPPTMTHMEAMKQGAHYFNNNVRLSSKLTIFGIGIALIIFALIGMFH